MNIDIWAEIFGVLALIFGLIAYQMKDPRFALWMLCIPCVFWIFHFLVLVQVSGLIISIIALIRNLCAAKFSDKYMKIVTATCLASCFLLIFPSVHNIKDLLPLGAATAISMAIFFRDIPFKFRSFNILGELSWLLYGLYIASFSLSVASGLMLSSIFICIMRHDVKIKILQPKQVQLEGSL